LMYNRFRLPPTPVNTPGRSPVGHSILPLNNLSLCRNHNILLIPAPIMLLLQIRRQHLQESGRFRMMIKQISCPLVPLPWTVRTLMSLLQRSQNIQLRNLFNIHSLLLLLPSQRWFIMSGFANANINLQTPHKKLIFHLIDPLCASTSRTFGLPWSSPTTRRSSSRSSSASSFSLSIHFGHIFLRFQFQKLFGKTKLQIQHGVNCRIARGSRDCFRAMGCAWQEPQYSEQVEPVQNIFDEIVREECIK
jgi:hypothetical protein